MTTPLLLILVVAIAYLATHVAYEWLARRLLVVSGAEYLVLGVLLGPQVSGLFPADAAVQFRPLVILGIGWLGLAVGMQFRLQRLLRIPAVRYRLSLVQSVCTLALVGAGASMAVAYVYQLPAAVAVIPGMALGAIAVASTPTGLDVAFGRTATRAPVLEQIEVALGMDALVSVLGFGLLLAWAHAAPPVAVRALTTTEWVVVTLGIGLVGGTLFHLFLGEERDADRLFVSLAGAVIVTSGAAAYLDLSPALAALVMGALLANTMRSPAPVQRVLAASERPLYYTLLLLAGASWAADSAFGWWLVLAHYVVLRTLAKLWGSGVVTWMNRAHPDVGLDWGRGLIGQGRLAIALALDYARRSDLPQGDLVFTCAALSVLFTEFAGARFVRSVAGPLMGRG